MNADELLKLNNNKEIVLERGRKSFICNKYMYFNHEEYEKLEDMTSDEQKERFRDNYEIKEPKKKIEYSFKNF